jgi:hypothetical protein
VALLCLDLFPLSIDTLALNPVIEFRAIDLIAGNREHGADVAQMLFRAAFAVVFELADDCAGMPTR